MVSESITISKEFLDDFILSIDMKKIINESSGLIASTANAVDDGPRYWWGDFKSYADVQNNVTKKLGMEIVDYLVPDKK